MLSRLTALVLFVVFVCTPVYGVMPGEELDDPALEARARGLTAELRCLVCDNESIDASGAPLARDLRLLVREKLVDGYTDDEIIAYLVERYGPHVRLRPPFSPLTWALWIGPFIVGGFAALYLGFRARHVASTNQSTSASNALSEAEEAELASLKKELDENVGKTKT